MPKHNLSKAQLIASVRQNNKLITASNKAHLLLTIGVLWDIFHFEEKDIELFMDSYGELLDSYNAGHEDIHKWAENVEKETGIRIEI